MNGVNHAYGFHSIPLLSYLFPHTRTRAARAQSHWMWTDGEIVVSDKLIMSTAYSTPYQLPVQSDKNQNFHCDYARACGRQRAIPVNLLGRRHWNQNIYGVFGPGWQAQAPVYKYMNPNAGNLNWLPRLFYFIFFFIYFRTFRNSVCRSWLIQMRINSKNIFPNERWVRGSVGAWERGQILLITNNNNVTW